MTAKKLYIKPTERIMCVDDDQAVLDAYQRALGRRYHLELFAESDKALLAFSQEPDAYAVVVSDMLMPGINGVQLLARVAEMSPSCIRMMLTGHSSLETAISAINEGHIFRFLLKPCAANNLASALDACIQQHRLLKSKRDLLSKTLAGTLKLLSDVLGQLQPKLTDTGPRIRSLIQQLCKKMDVNPEWEVEVAANLSSIGLVLLPSDMVDKVVAGKTLSDQEKELYENHVVDASNLLSNIPYLENVARIVLYQRKGFDGSGYPDDDVQGTKIPLGARILHVALSWDEQLQRGLSEELAISHLMNRTGEFDPLVLEDLCELRDLDNTQVVRRILLNELKEGMLLAENVVTKDDTVLCKKGVAITTAVMLRLRNYHINMGIKQPIQVFMPISDLSVRDLGSEEFDPKNGTNQLIFD